MAPPSEKVTTSLDPTLFFDDKPSNESAKYRALVILNYRIPSTELLEHLWGKCGVRICADGAANELFDLYEGEDHALPDAVHGDLDSIRPEITEYYKTRGVPVTQEKDDYCTDFGKVMKLLSQKTPHITDVLVLGGLGGRVDQGVGVLGELLREERRARSRFRKDQKEPISDDGKVGLQESSDRKLKIWLVSERSISFWVDNHEKSIIHIGSTTETDSIFTRNAGILPLLGRAYITTKGLTWDVSAWETEMSGNVSTSNYTAAETLEVETDVAVLFTIERRKFSYR